ncbi:AMP-binding protein, partial [Candidatus Fermentibacterales bacterium]|nr:AMP-binding protein [Candidatus Fermentibacterales bacterium]
EGFVELASRLKAGPLLVRLVRGNGGVAGAGPVPMEELEAIGRGRPLPDPPGPEDIAAICYTSGTMGRAKGVVLTHSNICSVINQMLRLVDLRRDDVFLSVLPVHHTYECTCGLLAPMHMQATVAFCRGLRHVAEDLAGSGATVMLGVPLLWESMYRRVIDGIKGRRGGALRLAFGTAASRVLGLFGREGDRRRLLAPLHRRLGGRVRLFVSGGAAQDPLVSRGFRDLGFDFIQGYGLTEASPLIAVNRETAFRDSSVGLPLPDMDVRIDDPDGEGNGEIVVRGPNVMVGYHEDPEETRAVLRDGWLHTGDLGHFDRDGFLYVTGRKKNVIIAKNGKNVYPEELEVVLTRSALISEAMVFGRQSASKGEEIAAVVVADTEALIGALESSGRRLSREIAAELLRGEIRSFNQSQPAFKRIASFVIFEGELPRTTTRKIRRRDVLREVGLAPGESFGV